MQLPNVSVMPQVPNPATISVTGAAPTPQPQNRFTSLIQSIIGNLNPMGNGAVGNAIDKADQWIESPKQTTIVPTINAAPSIDYTQQHPILGALGNLGNMALNLPGALVNGVARTVVDTPVDLGREISAGVNGETVPYDQLKSPFTKLGYQASTAINGAGNAPTSAQEVLGNVGQGAGDILSGAGIGAASDIVAGDAATSVGSRILTGAGTGAAYGAASGFAGGLDQNRNAPTVAGQLEGAAVSGAEGAVGGAVLGGVTAAGAAGFHYLSGEKATPMDAPESTTKPTPEPPIANQVDSNGDLTVYHGSGNFRPGGQGNNMFGDGTYYTPDQEVAKEFGGDVSATKVNPKNIYTIENQTQYDQVMSTIAKTMPGDPIENMPKFFGQMGYQGVAGNPEAFGAEAGINLFDPSLVKSVKDISDSAAARSATQIEIESRLNSGDTTGAKQVIDALPDSDPNKAPLEKLLTPDNEADENLKKGVAAVKEAYKHNAPQAGQSIVYGMRDDGTFGPLSEKAAAATVNSSQRSDYGQEVADLKSGKIKPPAFNPSNNIDDALHQASSVQTLIAPRAGIVDRMLQHVEASNQDIEDIAGHKGITELINQAKEHPDRVDEYAQKTSNPEQFKQTIAAYQNFTDYLHKLNTQLGTELGYRENYVRHSIDLTDPEDAEKFMNQYGTPGVGQNFQPGYLKSAVFDSIDEMRQAGYDYKQQSATNAFRDLTKDNINYVKGQALVQAVNRTFENGAVDIEANGGVPFGYKQSRIPGLEGTAFSPEAYEKLQNLEPAKDPGGFWKVYDWTNQHVKETALSLGTFHPLNIVNRMESALIGTGYLPDVMDTASAFLSNDAFDKQVNDAVNDGNIERAAKIGVKLTQGVQKAAYDDSFFDKLGAFNPAHQLNDATFRRLQDSAALTLVDANKDAIDKLDWSDPTDRAKGYELGKQIMSSVLTVNRDVALHNPETMKWFSRVALAPSVLEAKLNTVTGLFKEGAGGNMARGRLAAAVIIGAIISEASRKLFTGQFSSSPQAALTNDVLDPGVVLPYKNDSGIQQVAKLPTNEVSELGRPLSGFINPNSGSGTGEQQLERYAGARMAAIPSVAEKVLTNTDYYGNPLVDPFQNQNPSLLDRAKAVIPAELPIAAVQANKYYGGDKTPGDLASALINTTGLRVGDDPEDAKYQSEQQYFGGQTQFYNSLNPNEQAIFNTLNPTKKDTDGNIVFNKANITSAANAAELASQPAFAQKYAQYQKSNQTPSSGVYQPGQDYSVGTAVTYNGNTYVAIKPASGVVPGSEQPPANGQTNNNVWAYQDPIWNLSGNDLINALQARAAVGISDKSSLDPSATSTKTSSEIYFQNPNLFQGAAAVQKQAGAGNYDPIYDLTGAQAQQALYVKAMNANAPASASSDPYVQSIKAQPWYKQFSQSEQQYYTANPLPSWAVSKDSAAYPEMPDNLVKYSAYIASLPSGTGAKTAAYNTPTGQQLQQYYNTLDQYNAQKQSNLLQTPVSVAATQYAPGYSVSPTNVTPGVNPTAISAQVPTSTGVAPLNVNMGGSSSGSSSTPYVRRVYYQSNKAANAISKTKKPQVEYREQSLPKAKAKAVKFYYPKGIKKITSTTLR